MWTDEATAQSDDDTFTVDKGSHLGHVNNRSHTSTTQTSNKAFIPKGVPNPVVGAVVSAVVTRPSSRAVTVVLHDDGAEPDMMADDGVYAAHSLNSLAVDVTT